MSPIKKKPAAKPTAKQLILAFIEQNYQGKRFSVSSIMNECPGIKINRISVKTLFNNWVQSGFIRVVARGKIMEAFYRIDDGKDEEIEQEDVVVLTEFGVNINAALLSWRTALPEFARHV